ncbi:hypothetical protein SteCoe_23796 [Stentor coeruleus]|uniref:Uncharacterized protein n=1 Tax=Stentor coeruleus TaxID=5963 RepID=A0A1R2BJ56_9CILI|nr:hypothetical protein SteCoe_23796 [Stentor coeruleus]
MAESSVSESILISQIECLKAENLKLKHIISQKSLIRSYNEKTLTEHILLDKEKSKLEQVKQEVLLLKSTIEKERTKLKNQSLEIERFSTSDPENLECSITLSDISSTTKTFKIQDFESKIKELDIRESNLVKKEAKLNRFLLEIKQSIEDYNKLFEAREAKLDMMIAENQEKESVLNKQIFDMKLVQDNIFSSKKEIDEFNNVIIPAFQEYNLGVNQLLSDLYAKKQELNIFVERTQKIIEKIEPKVFVEKQIELLRLEYEKKVKDIDEKHSKLIIYEAKIKEKEKGLNETVMRMTKELQEQLEKVKIKEKEVDFIRKKLEEEKLQNEKFAMMLKVTNLEFENKKNKENERIRAKKEKLKILKVKLGSYLKNQEIKDREEIAKLNLSVTMGPLRSHSLI